jgi:cell division protein FtsQ
LGERKRRDLTQTWTVFKLFLVGIFVVSFVYLFNQFRLSQYFPINTVRVYGVKHLDRVEVQELLTPLVSRGFFGVNVEFMRERLLPLPWVADIIVRRSWPDQVDIIIKEKNAVARFNHEHLLSDNGEIFSPDMDTISGALPQFVGPPGQQVAMLRYFKQINRLLIPLHVKIVFFELTPYFSWNLILDNGIALKLGHKDILTRLDQFVKVYPKIVRDKEIKVDYIDLRPD